MRDSSAWIEVKAQLSDERRRLHPTRTPRNGEMHRFLQPWAARLDVAVAAVQVRDPGTGGGVLAATRGKGVVALHRTAFRVD